MNRKLGLGAIAVVTVLGAATACGSSGSSSGSAGSAGNAAGGPFRVDTASCPSEATTALAAGAPIKVGTVWPLSGPYAAIGSPIVAGMKLAFDEANAAGGVDGHKIELVTKDDVYDPTKTLPMVTELIQKDQIFTLLGQGGTPNVAASQPVAEQNCMPQIFVGSGAPQWGDPTQHPWTIGGGYLPYSTEAQSWSEYIKKGKPDAKVAYLQLDNEGGKAYATSFAEAAKKDGLTVVASQKTSPTAASVENEITNLLAASPDTVIVMSVGASCGKAIAALAQGGYTGQIIAAYTCAPDVVLPTLGEAAKGVKTLGIAKSATNVDDPDIKKFVDAAQKFGNIPVNDTVLTGYRSADIYLKTLTAAAKLDGGLTRANVMNATWNLDTTWFAAFGGVAKTDGTKDSYPSEYAQMTEWDAANKELVPTGDPIDREGKTGTYVS